MIRWIAATLVLLNLGLFMWVLWYTEEPAEDAAPPARAEFNAQKMKRLNESGVRLTPRSPPPAPAPSTPAETATPACYRLGPFASAELSDKAAVILGERQVLFERAQEERRTVTGYRITLPPLPSKQAAEEKRRELTRLGFKDHAVINEEGMRNGLSLGLYTVEANAQRHVARLLVKGIKADMQTLHQTRIVYWLDVRLTEPVLADLKKMEWGSAEVLFAPEPCPAAPPATPPPEAATKDEAPNP